MNTATYYVLDGQNPVEATDVFAWSKWFEDSKTSHSRLVGRTGIRDRNGNEVAFVSTVFLGINMACDSKKPAVLWETMVFGGDLDSEMQRCPGTWHHAEIMHEKMVAKCNRHQRMVEKKEDLALVLSLADEISNRGAEHVR